MRISWVILLVQGHPWGIFFPGNFQSNRAWWLGFSQPFQEAQVKVLLCTASILYHSFFLILWLVAFIFLSRLYVHSSNNLEHIWKVNKELENPQNYFWVASGLGFYLVLFLQVCGRTFLYLSGF